ncbi:MAG: hypothetical protein A2506_08195 [Elusimicrobia bacterium RIFOXYD12_FULL_66_9]|nr:MAG: hypothetical protein A2506_08195 [Elusimicrobia bacterium RIFOXYD12_FULL_66_9]
MITSSCVVLFALAAAAAPVSPAAPAAATSLIGASTHTISSLYTGDRVRDPFLPASMGGSAPMRAVDEDAEPVATDIHSLQLRGLLKDRSSDFAIFGSDTGQTYLLRAGRLFDSRNKRVPGVTGRIQLKQKRVELVTADKDVQVFVLGETDENNEKDKKP